MFNNANVTEAFYPTQLHFCVTKLIVKGKS